MRKHNPEDKEALLEEIAGLKQRIKELEQPVVGENGFINPFQDHEGIYRFIAENTADIISIMDMDLHFVYISPSLTRIRGVTPEEAVAQTLEQILTPGSLEKAFAVYKEEMVLEASGTADPERTRLVELEIYHKDGTGIWLENNISFIRNQQGAPTVILVVSRDITDRKRAERNLMESEWRFRVATELSGQLVWDLDLDTEKIAWAGAVQKITGFTAEEFQEVDLSAWREMIHPDDRERVASTLDKAIKDGTKYGCEYRLQKKDASYLYVEDGGMVLSFDKNRRMMGTLQDISERKKAEEAQKESESKYRLIAENMVDIISILDMNLRYTFVSPSILRVRGFTVEEAMKETLEETMTPESLKVVNKVFEEELALENTGRADPERTRILELEEYKKDGTLIWVENTLSFLRDEDQRPAGILVLARDITERKKAEQSLRESENNLRTIFDNTYDAIFIHDTDGKVMDVNQTLLDMYGVTREQALQMSIAEDFSTPDNPIGQLKDRWNRVLQGESLTFEWEARRPNDGSIFDVEVALNGITLGNRKVVLANVRDISSRKTAEKILKESEEKFRALAEQNIDTIMRFDRQYRHLYVNPVVEKRTGIPAEGFIGKVYGEVGLAEHQSPFLKEAIDHVFQSREVHRIECRLPAGNWIDWILMPELDQSGHVKAVITSGRDITDRKALEEQLRQSQKMEAVGQLAGGVAHDFNNMLQAIIGYTEIVLSSPSLHESDHAKITEIRKAGLRAAELTRQLLAFSRRQVLHLGPLNLNLALNNLLKMLRRLIGENIELTLHPEEDLWTVNADRGQMEQVLLNLCINARDAMPQGGQLAIETRNVVLGDRYCAQNEAVEPGRYVRLSVTDSGCGMSPEIRMKAFEPFFTTKEKGEGTGLGLATVYGIVRQHNGMIHVYSEIEKGSRFSVYLPVIESIRMAAVLEPERPVSGGHESILIAEDDEHIRLVTDEILRSAGYHVLMAVDGEDAVRMYHSCGEKIDLLLLDVVMPKKSGREVFDEIQSVNPAIRCLFMSGYSESAVHTHFILDKGFLLIQKPFNNNELLRMIRQALDQR
ncbi:MAG: PAS domain S-box protein [Deltaproteobacteria bacterium]|nr:PAS domain S-box protein [Deltaproteobacteria bacterium]